MTTTKKSMDMTNGPVLKNLILIALPLALSGVLQLLFNAADLIIVGQFSSTPEQSLAAVSSNGSLYSLIVNLALGLSVGANVIMAQSLGAKNSARTQKTLHTAILLSLIIGVIIGVLGFFLARPLLILMNTDPTILDKATLYLQIVFLGFPASSLYNFGSAILRAKGDTRRPLIFLTVAGIINVLLNVTLVLFGLDVAGVAIATFTSHLFSAICILVTLAKEQGLCNFSVKKLRIHKAEFFDIIKVGLPSGLLSSCYSIANVIIQSAVNTYALAVNPSSAYAIVAGNSTGANIEGFVFNVIASIGQSVSPYVAQNYGAGKFVRIKRILGAALFLSVVFWAVISAIVLLFRMPLIGLYVNDPNTPEGQIIIEYATIRLFSLTPIYFLCSFQDTIIYSLRSMNRIIVPMIVSFFFVCVFRIFWVTVIFPLVFTLPFLFLSWPVSWVLLIVIEGIHLILVYNKLVNQKINDQGNGDCNDFYSSESVLVTPTEDVDSSLTPNKTEQSIDSLPSSENSPLSLPAKE